MPLSLVQIYLLFSLNSIVELSYLCGGISVCDLFYSLFSI